MAGRLRRAANINAPISATLRWTAERSPAGASGAGELTSAERRQFLAANTLVPVGHDVLQPILPERGWVPIDASEAAKHPEQRELFFGSHPADRIHCTTGRDLVVSAGSSAMPLNYFIYPVVELSGKPWRVKLETRFSYRVLPTRS